MDNFLILIRSKIQHQNIFIDMLKKYPEYKSVHQVIGEYELIAEMEGTESSINDITREIFRNHKEKLENSTRYDVEVGKIEEGILDEFQEDTMKCFVFLNLMTPRFEYMKTVNELRRMGLNCFLMNEEFIFNAGFKRSFKNVLEIDSLINKQLFKINAIRVTTTFLTFKSY